MSKRRGLKPKARTQSKKARRATHPTSSQTTGRKIGLGTEIAVLFRGIGLRTGEEIPELHDIKLQIPNFDE